MSSRKWRAYGDRMTDEQVNALVARGRAALAAVLDQELDTQEGLARIYAAHGLPAPASPKAAGPGSSDDDSGQLQAVYDQIAMLETTLPHASSQRAAPRVHLRAVLAAAAAVVVVVATTLTLTLAQAPSALAQLTSATSRTAGQSYHFSATTTDVPRNGQGTPPATQTAFSGAFDPARATGEETFSTGAQIRFTGGYVYLNPGRTPAGQPRLPNGKSWLAAPSPAFGLPASASPQLKLFAGMVGAAGTSPQSLFSLLKSVSKVTSQGSVSGHGWTGTRYAFFDTFALGPAGSGLPTANATGTVDVDQQGRIRHLDVIYTLHATPSTQPERVTIEMTFSDFGGPVSVSTPPAGDVFMP